MKRLADELWGKGGVLAGQTAREVLLAKGVKPDFEVLATPNSRPAVSLDFIHRGSRAARRFILLPTESTNSAVLDCAFRVAGRAPELWDARERRASVSPPLTQRRGGRTTLPLEFAPCGSCFVVFREPAATAPGHREEQRCRIQDSCSAHRPVDSCRLTRSGADPNRRSLTELVSWTARSEPGIKFYSGTAIYREHFERRPMRPANPVWLDLGDGARVGGGEGQRQVLRHHLVAAVSSGHQPRAQTRR